MNELSNINEVVSEIGRRSVNTDRFVVAVSGFAGSGKSSISRAFEKALGDCSIIKVDDFIKTNENGAVYGHPHDLEALEESLRKIKTGSSVVAKTYDWKTNKAGQKIRPTTKYTIIEGPVSLLQEKLLSYFDFKVWIDCPLDIATIRGKRRDKEEYHVDFEELWDRVWLPEQEKYYQDHRPDLKADIYYKNY